MKLISKRSFFKQEAGGVTVEFVLLAPIMFMLLLIILDFGTYLLKKQSLSSITRGVITVISSSPNFAIDEASLLSMVENELGPEAKNVELEINPFCLCTNIPTGCQISCNGLPPRMEIQAKISYDHALNFPYPGIGDVLKVSNTLDFRVR